MKKNITQDRQFLINRLGYIRNKVKLSAREVSLRMGMSPQYIAQIESGRIVLTIEKLFQILEICGSSPAEFFSEDIFRYNEMKEITKAYEKLSDESKDTIKDLINKLK